MKYFLDTAKFDEITYAYKNWAIDGVTTNPRHILAAGKTAAAVMDELAKEFEGVDFPISVEINPHHTKAEDMVAEAKKLAKISKNFVVKVPCNEEGLIAAYSLAKAGVKVNVTLVFSTSQALQAARVGARYVSPFVGWKESSGEDTSDFIADIVDIFDIYEFDTEIIVAALRNGKQIVDAALAGAHIVTAGFQVFKDSFYHPFTDVGLKRFSDAWDQTKK